MCCVVTYDLMVGVTRAARGLMSCVVLQLKFFWPCAALVAAAQVSQIMFVLNLTKQSHSNSLKII